MRLHKKLPGDLKTKKDTYQGWVSKPIATSSLVGTNQ